MSIQVFPRHSLSVDLINLTYIYLSKILFKTYWVKHKLFAKPDFELYIGNPLTEWIRKYITCFYLSFLTWKKKNIDIFSEILPKCAVKAVNDTGFCWCHWRICQFLFQYFTRNILSLPFYVYACMYTAWRTFSIIVANLFVLPLEATVCSCFSKKQLLIRTIRAHELP